MAATFSFDEDNGAGPASSGTVTKTDWKNEDSRTDNYASFPITAGNNSYDKWVYGHFSGTYNNILNGLWAHTATAFGGGLTLMASKAMTADGDRLAARLLS